MQAIIKNRQTLLDIAMQHCGAVESAFYLALLNDLSLTDRLITGNNIMLTPVVAKGVAAAFKTDENIPISQEEGQIGGIGYWNVGLNFEVN